MAAAAAAARRHYRGLTWLGRARRAGGAPADDSPGVHRDILNFKPHLKAVHTAQEIVNV